VSFDPEAVLRTIEAEKITAIFLVPTMLYVLLDHPLAASTDLSSLQLVLYGASPMSPARLLAAQERLGPIFQQFYAQTEAPNTCTTLRPDEHHGERLSSCGRPFMGVDVALLDDDDNPVAPGEVGEICVRSPLVMDGYWKQPEQTAETLRNGWLHTGDMARADDDGFLYIVDRRKDMIISGGFNVYPREVEDVLTTHPAVAMAAVIGVPDDKWGEAVKAIIVRKGDVEADELIALVKERKGSVLAPKTVDFVDSLPLTPVGKIDKKPLRAPYWDSGLRQVN
jgi:fatty-acyl-CoA synthase